MRFAKAARATLRSTALHKWHREPTGAASRAKQAAPSRQRAGFKYCRHTLGAVRRQPRGRTLAILALEEAAESVLAVRPLFRTFVRSAQTYAVRLRPSRARLHARGAVRKRRAATASDRRRPGHRGVFRGPAASGARHCELLRRRRAHYAKSPSSCAACTRLAFRSRRRCNKVLCRWVASAPT